MVLSMSTMEKMQKMPARMAKAISPTLYRGAHFFHHKSRVLNTLDYHGLLFQVGLDGCHTIPLHIIAFQVQVKRGG